MLISIIAPVYNTAIYLHTCIESILNQTYSNIEVILVDDGSDDESLEICKEYSKQDSRVRVIANEHQGLVTARKSGVKSAKGEYCIFVDSDDWISTDLIQEIVPLVEEGTTDIVNYNLQSVDGEKTMDWSYTIPEGIYKGTQMENIYSRMMYDFEYRCPGIIQSLCTKMIKRSLLWTSMEAVDKNITLGEDAAVVYKAMLLSEKVAITDKCLYFYRVRQNSMCRAKDQTVFTKISYFQNYMSGVFKEYNKKYNLEQQLKYYLVPFIRKGLEDIYGVKLLNLYQLPFRLQEQGKRVVLYGAGNVGRSYYKQLQWADGVRIAAWVDKGLKGQKIYDQIIEAPEILESLEYDHIIIAVKNQDIAEKIKGQLLSYTSEEKILWEGPQINTEFLTIV